MSHVPGNRGDNRLEGMDGRELVLAGRGDDTKHVGGRDLVLCGRGWELAAAWCAACPDISETGEMKQAPPSFTVLAAFCVPEQISGRILFTGYHAGMPEWGTLKDGKNWTTWWRMSWDWSEGQALELRQGHSVPPHGGLGPGKPPYGKRMACVWQRYGDQASWVYRFCHVAAQHEVEWNDLIPDAGGPKRTLGPSEEKVRFEPKVTSVAPRSNVRILKVFRCGPHSA